MEIPKPSKKERLSKKASEKRSLADYRHKQVELAIIRDRDLCAICFFKYSRLRRRQEVHHVYSRGRRAGDWREHYTCLLCVCKECHPLPIQQPGASASLGWVEDILEKANANPINKYFRAPDDELF